ncbi:MAG: Hpt domain-containing protein, partial [Lachnospiraceae bacterium]|nr:Hpt domain-containing protein [Lachnospiraceae bacterium]
ADTPVICLTADAVGGAKERYLNLGFDDYLTKPVDGAELEKTLLEYIPKEKIARGIETGNEPEITEIPAVMEIEAAEEITEIAEMPEVTEIEALEESGEDGSQTDESLFEKLSAIGIDTATGLRFSAGEADIYKEVLLAFANEEKNKAETIKLNYEAKDWEEYGVYVHAIKSTAKTIGAGELSELAAGLERAANAGDGQAIEKDHERTMKMYSLISDTIIKCLKS